MAYSISPKLVARAGFSLYYDRGEFFTEFSPPACDTVESSSASGGRNIFRGSFQKRASLAVFKETAFREKYRPRIAMEVFNVTNASSFDTPNNN